MENVPAIKTDRVLCIYFKLVRGDSFTKKELAQQFQVTERSIQRDLGVLRCFLDEQNTGQEIIYDKETRRYHMEFKKMKLPVFESYGFDISHSLLFLSGKIHLR